MHLDDEEIVHIYRPDSPYLVCPPSNPHSSTASHYHCTLFHCFRNKHIFAPHDLSSFFTTHSITMAPSHHRNNNSATARARRFFGFGNRKANKTYLEVRSEIRSICKALDVFNQSSERWFDACFRVVDSITYFSRHQSYRRWWNNRENTLEGQRFYRHLKTLIVDSAGNLRTMKTSNNSVTVNTSYHADDSLPSCVSYPNSPAFCLTADIC